MRTVKHSDRVGTSSLHQLTVPTLLSSQRPLQCAMIVTFRFRKWIVNQTGMGEEELHDLAQLDIFIRQIFDK